MGHQSQQAGGLERHGFATGIGTGDKRDARLVGHGDIGGDDFGRVDEGMAGLDEHDGRILTVLDVDHDWFNGVQMPGKARFGDRKVEFGQRRDAGADVAGLCADHVGQLGQNPGDFVGLVQLQFAEFVVELHHDEWFDVQGDTFARLVMHEPFDHPLVAGFDRYDVAAVTHGDDGLLQGIAVLPRRDDVLQALLDTCHGDADLAPERTQLGAGRVEHFAVVVDRAVDAVFDVGEDRKPLDGVVEERDAHWVDRRKALFEAPGGTQRPCDFEQRTGVEHATTFGQAHAVADVAGGADAQIGVGVEQIARFTRLGQRHADDIGVARRRQRLNHLLRRRKAGVHRQHVPDRREFEGCQGMFWDVHWFACSGKSS